MKKRTRFVAMLLTATMALSTALTGCGGTDKTTDDNTIRVMLFQDKPTGFDDVLAEFHERTKDTLGITLDVEWVPGGDYKDKLNLKMTAGEDYDLVFDATFIKLRQMAADGIYKDLSPYFNNDEYPGIKAAFSETIVENNKFYGTNCVIPIMRAYGNGIPSIHYRQDLADKYGIGKIDSYEKLEEFFKAVQENETGMTPLGVGNSRGFYEMFKHQAAEYPENHMAFVAAGIGWYVLLNEDNTEVVAIAGEGEGDEAYKDFPAPYNKDFAIERYEKYREWRKYLETDSMNQTDANTMFYSGKCAAIIGTLDDCENNLTQMAAYNKDAKIGEFIYVDAVRNKEEGAIGATYMANNFLAIPETSTKADLTMKFIDWLFSSQENNDLFALGIEGVNYVNEEDGTYTLTEDNKYVFPGYTLTWNPNYTRFDSRLSDEVVDYRKYELEESTYVKNLLAGFAFDQEPVTTEMAQISAILSEVDTPLAHGALDNPIQVKQENTAKCFAKGGLEKVREELKNQINTFLAERNQ
ncbi:MAG: extracellular solute-binding protein [Lachnospiraceae bacterium]